MCQIEFDLASSPDTSRKVEKPWGRGKGAKAGGRQGKKLRGKGGGREKKGELLSLQTRKNNIYDKPQNAYVKAENFLIDRVLYENNCQLNKSTLPRAEDWRHQEFCGAYTSAP